MKTRINGTILTLTLRYTVNTSTYQPSRCHYAYDHTATEYSNLFVGVLPIVDVAIVLDTPMSMGHIELCSMF